MLLTMMQPSASCSLSPGYQDIAKHLRTLQQTLIELCDNSATELIKNLELEMEQAPVTDSPALTPNLAAENEVHSNFQTQGSDTQTEPGSEACIIS